MKLEIAGISIVTILFTIQILFDGLNQLFGINIPNTYYGLISLGIVALFALSWALRKKPKWVLYDKQTLKKLYGISKPEKAYHHLGTLIGYDRVKLLPGQGVLVQEAESS